MPKRISACSISPHAPTQGKECVRDWKTPAVERPGRYGLSSPSLSPSMAYKVRITDRAERDFAEIYAAVHGDTSEAALQWLIGLERAILSLEQNPARCPRTPENR